MKRVAPFIALGSAVAVTTFGILATGTKDEPFREAPALVAGQGAVHAAAAPGPELPPPLERLERGIAMKQGTRVELGSFELRDGRTLRLHTAETEDGRVCLVDEGTETGASAGCLAGGLFELRPVAFLVNSDGGPEQFAELYLGGVAAPAVGSVSLVRSDGSSVPLTLNPRRAFLYESTPAELERDLLPAAFLLYGRNARFVGRVGIPSLR